MTAKHTPGPWETNGYGIETVSSPCFVIGKAYAGLHAAPNLKIAEANALLMAAAPDLLEALQELLSLCDRQRDFNDDGDGRALERARAAIKKAVWE